MLHPAKIDNLVPDEATNVVALDSASIENASVEDALAEDERSICLPFSTQAPNTQAPCTQAPFSNEPVQNQKPGRELVVLAHGIASTRWVLTPLAKRLRKAGYETKLYGYPSVWWSNRSHGRKLAKVLRKIAVGYDHVHLVGHSMGGIVSRCALEEELPENFGRVVMIAPPNRGSHVATRRAWWQSWAVPTLLELKDTPESLVNQMGPLPDGRQVGILAASKDSVLRPGQTELDGQADHHTVEGHHSGVLWTRETADLTRHFLQHGSFGLSNEKEHESSAIISRAA